MQDQGYGDNSSELSCQQQNSHKWPCDVGTEVKVTNLPLLKDHCSAMVDHGSDMVDHCLRTW